VVHDTGVEHGDDDTVGADGQRDGRRKRGVKLLMVNL
jgi:hypothetical protein